MDRLSGLIGNAITNQGTETVVEETLAGRVSTSNPEPYFVSRIGFILGILVVVQDMPYIFKLEKARKARAGGVRPAEGVEDVDAVLFPKALALAHGEMQAAESKHHARLPRLLSGVIETGVQQRMNW